MKTTLILACAVVAVSAIYAPRAQAKAPGGTAVKANEKKQSGSAAARSFFAAAFELMRSRQFEAAIAQFEKGLAIDASDYKAHLLLGQCYEETGALENARAQFELVVRAAPPTSQESAVAATRVAAIGAKAEGRVATDPVARNFPTREITLVIPYAASGIAGVVANAMAVPLGEQLGQKVNVVAKPGRGGAIAAEYVRSASPDGYTLLLGSAHLLCVIPAVSSSAKFQASDFVPIAKVVTAPLVLVANPNYPASTLQEFLEYGKTHGVIFGTPGPGTLGHVAGVLLNAISGTPVVTVPYRGTGPMVADLLGGQITAAMEPPSAIAQFVNRGTLRPLAVASSHRSPFMPTVPTFAESGVKAFEVDGGYALFAPAAISPAVSAKIGRAANAALSAADVQRTLQQSSLEVEGKSAAQYVAKFPTGCEQLHNIASKSNIRWD